MDDEQEAVRGAGAAREERRAQKGTGREVETALETGGRQGEIGVVFLFWCAASVVGGLVYGAMHRPVSPILLLLGMGVWEYASPGGNPRSGILRFETTRGDRLFLSLLGSAFIHLAWLGLIGPNLWWALALSVVYAIGVFRYV